MGIVTRYKPTSTMGPNRSRVQSIHSCSSFYSPHFKARSEIEAYGLAKHSLAQQFNDEKYREKKIPSIVKVMIPQHKTGWGIIIMITRHKTDFYKAAELQPIKSPNTRKVIINSKSVNCFWFPILNAYLSTCRNCLNLQTILKYHNHVSFVFSKSPFVILVLTA